MPPKFAFLSPPLCEPKSCNFLIILVIYLKYYIEYYNDIYSLVNTTFYEPVMNIPT